MLVSERECVFALLLQLFSFFGQMKWLLIALIWQILLSGVMAVGMFRRLLHCDVWHIYCWLRDGVLCSLV